MICCIRQINGDMQNIIHIYTFNIWYDYKICYSTYLTKSSVFLKIKMYNFYFQSFKNVLKISNIGCSFKRHITDLIKQLYNYVLLPASRNLCMQRKRRCTSYMGGWMERKWLSWHRYECNETDNFSNPSWTPYP